MSRDDDQAGPRREEVPAQRALRTCACATATAPACTPRPCSPTRRRARHTDCGSAADPARRSNNNGGNTSAQVANCTYLWDGPRDTAKRAVAHGDIEDPLDHLTGGIGEVPFEVGRVPPVLGNTLAADERRQRPPVGLERNVRPDELADGRQHVDRLGDRVDDGAAPALGIRARIDHDQRDVVALVPVAQLLEQPVVAAHFAVVTGDDDQCRLGQAALPEVSRRAIASPSSTSRWAP